MSARLRPAAAGVMPRSRASLVRPGMVILAVWCAPILVGCGHPATKAECDEIFTISAAIKLREQSITEPAVVKQRTDDARAVRGDALIQKCVGRRITDGAMRCVRAAKTAEAFDECLSW